MISLTFVGRSIVAAMIAIPSIAASQSLLDRPPTLSGDWVGANNLSRFIVAYSRPRQSVIFVRERWGVMGTDHVYFTTSSEAYPHPTVHGNQPKE